MPLALWSQDSLRVTIEGIVVDKLSGDILPEVMIHVKGNTASTMTNADGRFQLKLEKIPSRLEVSAIGYNRTTVNKEHLQNALEGKPLRIEMVPQLTVLSDVYVYSPENILNAAIERIVDNYPTGSTLYEGFYRETISKRRKYVSVSEAVVQLYKTRYEQENTQLDLVHLLKGRSLMSQRARDTISVMVKGGPTEAINLDLVKDRSMFLCPEMLAYYQLDIEQPKVIDGRPQYVISFHPSYQHWEIPLFSGLIYIDYSTLAFTRIEYNMDMSDPFKVTNVMLARKPFGMRFRPRGLNIVVNYHFDGEQSHMSYMRTSYLFDCDWKKRGLATHYEAVSEMLITGYRPSEEPPSRRNSFHEDDLLSRQLADFSDPDFWRDYNILLPSESLENALTKLKKSYSEKQ